MESRRHIRKKVAKPRGLKAMTFSTPPEPATSFPKSSGPFHAESGVKEESNSTCPVQNAAGSGDARDHLTQQHVGKDQPSQPVRGAQMDKVRFQRHRKDGLEVVRLSMPMAEGKVLENRKVTGFVAMISETEITRVPGDHMILDVTGPRFATDKAVHLLLQRCYDSTSPQVSIVKPDQSHSQPTLRPHSEVNRQDPVSEDLQELHCKTQKGATRPYLDLLELGPAYIERQEKQTTEALQEAIQALEQDVRRQRELWSGDGVWWKPKNVSMDATRDKTEEAIETVARPREKSSVVSTETPTSLATATSPLTSCAAMTSPSNSEKSMTSSPSFPKRNRMSPRLGNLMAKMKISGRDMVVRGGRYKGKEVSTPESSGLTSPYGEQERQEDPLPACQKLKCTVDQATGNVHWAKEVPLPEDPIPKPLQNAGTQYDGTFEARRRAILLHARSLLSQQPPAKWEEIVHEKNLLCMLKVPKCMFNPDDHEARQELSFGWLQNCSRMNTREQRQQQRKALCQPTAAPVEDYWDDFFM